MKIRGYLPTYRQPFQPDYSRLDYLMYAFADTTGNVTGDVSGYVSAAHKAGKKVLLSIGGVGASNFSTVITTQSGITTLVSKLVAQVSLYQFDGIDIDMEPIGTDANFTTFITALRTALVGKELSCAVGGWHAPLFAKIQDKFDHIGLMTYDLQGSTPSEQSALYGSPSVDEIVQRYISAGVLPSKLSIGIPFYTHKWVNNSYGGAITYTESLTPQPAGTFLSVESPMTIKMKIDYVRQKGLMGIIIWELSQDGGKLLSQFPVIVPPVVPVVTVKTNAQLRDEVVALLSQMKL